MNVTANVAINCGSLIGKWIFWCVSFVSLTYWPNLSLYLDDVLLPNARLIERDSGLNTLFYEMLRIDSTEQIAKDVFWLS